MLKSGRSFKSDNLSGIHPLILDSITNANVAHTKAYGDDSWTKKLSKKFEETFQTNCISRLTFNGTGTNVIALRTALQIGQSVITTDCSHLNSNETGAPEQLAGCKLLVAPHQNGKLTPANITKLAEQERLNSYHATEPKLVSITQATEYGTVYSTQELQDIKQVCNDLNLLLHIDCCRVFNAAEHLNCSLAAITSEIGADLISLGGTKNGAMLAEALIIFNPKLNNRIEFIHKNSLQMSSKNRFIACQYLALLEKGLWRTIAQQANQQATNITEEIKNIPNYKIIYPAETNAIFIEMALSKAKELEELDYCYIWNIKDSQAIVRLVTSFDNDQEDAKELIATLKQPSL